MCPALPPVADPTAEDLARAAEARQRFPQCQSRPMCLVSTREQALHLLEEDQVIRSWPVSTSRYGIGGQNDSMKTPTGAHRIAERIGDDAALHTVFKGRVAQEETAEIETEPRATGRECITTRILWLDGLEPGVNKDGDMDSYQRYIYIHGTHEEGLIGQAASIGCVRMRGADVIELFDQVSVDTLVLILP